MFSIFVYKSLFSLNIEMFYFWPKAWTSKLYMSMPKGKLSSLHFLLFYTLYFMGIQRFRVRDFWDSSYLFKNECTTTREPDIQIFCK